MRVKIISTTLILNLNRTSRLTSQPTVASASDLLILNDSSLAALALDGRDRTVLFQDRIGMVRQRCTKIRPELENESLARRGFGVENSTPFALLHNPNTTDDALIFVLPLVLLS